jgi:hypothetical protein
MGPSIRVEGFEVMGLVLTGAVVAEAFGSLAAG